MEKKMNNEELQSRREFFKRAAKGSLPVIGAMLLAHLPIESASAECACHWGCYSSCQGSCKYDSCKESCHGCKGHCKYQSKD